MMESRDERQKSKRSRAVLFWVIQGIMLAGALLSLALSWLIAAR